MDLGHRLGSDVFPTVGRTCSFYFQFPRQRKNDEEKRGEERRGAIFNPFGDKCFPLDTRLLGIFHFVPLGLNYSSQQRKHVRGLHDQDQFAAEREAWTLPAASAVPAEPRWRASRSPLMLSAARRVERRGGTSLTFDPLQLSKFVRVPPAEKNIHHLCTCKNKKNVVL